MAKRKFHLKQTNPDGRWLGLDFGPFIESHAPFADPVIRTTVGDDIDYGCLLAYCFRRFGYPQTGWDDYKELARYYLTTPVADLILCVSPSVSNRAALSLRFLVSDTAYAAVHRYAERARDEWERRSLDWAEQQGLPKWMPEWLEIYNSEYRNVFADAPPALDWRGAVNFRSALGEKGTRLFRLASRVAAFRKVLDKDYAKLDPWPEYYMRPFDVSQWNSDDPLLPLARAAMDALGDLRTPVGVRDQAIDAYGVAQSKRSVVRPASAAGYPCGALGNMAPSQFAALHADILALGNGNLKRGMRRAQAALSELK